MERSIIITAAFILDVLLGDPHWLWHPVQGIGAVVTWSERVLRKGLGLSEKREEGKEKKKLAGCLLVVMVLAVSVGIPALLLYGAGQANYRAEAFLSIVMCYQLLALKALKKESMKVYQALISGDIEKARQAVSMIVGRDTQNLTKEGITKAAVETVAENISDGVIAPLFYMFFFGPLGGFFYKAVNTMDSMVGYKNDRYVYVGWAAARLDDLLNFIPSRLSALFMIGAAFFLGRKPREAFYIWKRDRCCHTSPNSAQTESVCAGALGLSLGGDAWYFGELCHKPSIGDSKREAEPEDIRRANGLLYVTAFLFLAAGLLTEYFLRVV